MFASGHCYMREMTIYIIDDLIYAKKYTHTYSDSFVPHKVRQQSNLT